MSKKETKKKTEAHEQDKVAELTNDLQRLQAEFENYKKRTERDNESFKEYSEAEVVKDMLPILDNFELALNNASNKDEFVKGMELVYSQLFQALEDRGLKKIEVDGVFDPHLHEALLSEESDKESGTILQELQKGFIIKDRVIRHAKVKVAK